MIIYLHPMDYARIAAPEQLDKVAEEIREFREATTLEDVAEEAFDVMQALTGYLITLGVDLNYANRRHVEKLRRRERGR